LTGPYRDDIVPAMPMTYNEISARGLHRISALSDGLFAIAMTLIVLEIRVPDPARVTSDADLWQQLTVLAPKILTYFLSFLTLGIFWGGQQTQLNHFDHGDRNLTWIHLAFLAAVATMPFSTALLGEFLQLRLALLVYWINLAALGAGLYASWAYAERAGLVKSDTPPEVGPAIGRRIRIYQALYAFGAALAIVDTRLSIGFIVLTQLNSAIAPRIPVLNGF
jgi:uncharacterized membrane protein